jgi:hypothetical protein
MVVSTVLGQGEVEDLESLLFAETEAPKKPLVEIEKHFSVRLEASKACILTVVDFETTEIGIEQCVLLRKGSEVARNKGQGQKIPDVVSQTDDLFQPDYVSLVLDVDSYTPEKLLHLGYVATGLVTIETTISFVQERFDQDAVIFPFDGRNTEPISFSDQQIRQVG